MKVDTFTPWDAADYLDSEEDMNLYLEACIDEDEGDGAVISAALGDIACARNMATKNQCGKSLRGLTGARCC